MGNGTRQRSSLPLRSQYHIPADAMQRRDTASLPARTFSPRRPTIWLGTCRGFDPCIAGEQQMLAQMPGVWSVGMREHGRARARPTYTAHTRSIASHFRVHQECARCQPDAQRSSTDSPLDRIPPARDYFRESPMESSLSTLQSAGASAAIFRGTNVIRRLVWSFR